MSAPSTSGLSLELLLRVNDVKYGCFSLLCHFAFYMPPLKDIVQGRCRHIVGIKDINAEFETHPWPLI